MYSSIDVKWTSIVGTRFFLSRQIRWMDVTIELITDRSPSYDRPKPQCTLSILVSVGRNPVGPWVQKKSVE